MKKIVCQMCEKALAQKLNVLIYAKSLEQALQLDELLWTYKADSFIAHSLIEQNDIVHNSESCETEILFPYPVMISTYNNSDIDLSAIYSGSLLINLSNTIPAFHHKFNRMCEMIEESKDDKEGARNRYRFYRKKGYTPLNKYDL